MTNDRWGSVAAVFAVALLLVSTIPVSAVAPTTGVPAQPDGATGERASIDEAVPASLEPSTGGAIAGSGAFARVASAADTDAAASVGAPTTSAGTATRVGTDQTRVDTTPMRDDSATTISDSDVLSGPLTPETQRPTVVRAPTVATDAGDVRELTLVSGDTISVAGQGPQVTVTPASLNGARTISTGDGTYVVPDGVSFDRFSPRLFDVSYLTAHGYANADSIPVIVSLTPGATRDKTALADRLGIELTRTHDDPALIVGRVPTDRADSVFERLRTASAVEYVSLDAGAGPEPSSGTHTVRRQDVPANETVVAVVSTGVDESHPDLQGKELLERNFVRNASVTDESSRGTFLAGQIVGTGTASNGTYAGLAPNAKYMDLKVADSVLQASVSDVLAAIEFAANNGADVIVVSSTTETTRKQLRTAVEPVVQNATSDGAVVIAPAGGRPVPKTSPIAGLRKLGSLDTAPGAADSVVTVGTPNPLGRNLITFSARGPTPTVGVKPDVLAPGIYRTSVRSSNQRGRQHIRSQYTTKTGTMVSAGVVAGTAAKLVSQRPNLTVTELRGLLTSTATPIDGETAYEQGAGILNASRVMNTELFVTPGVLSVGSFNTNRTVTRTVTIHNTGDTNRTVSVAASATDTIDGSSGTVAVERSTVTVPADGTATVTLRVTTGDTPGLYSGRLTVTPETGPSVATAFGYARTHSVTVRKRGLNGGTVTGDPIVIDFTHPAFDWSRQATYTEGGVTFQTFADTLSVGSSGVHEATGQSVVLLDTVSVTENRTVTLNESETVTYEMDVSAVEKRDGALFPLYTEGVLQSTASYNGKTAVYEVRGARSRQRSIRLSQDSALNGSIVTTLLPQSSLNDGGVFDAPQVYILHRATIGVSESRTFSVDPSQLATIDMTYYRTERGQTYSVIPYVKTKKWQEQTVFGPPFGISDRIEQTVYISPGGASYAFSPFQKSAPRWLEWAHQEVQQPGSERIITLNTHPASGRLLKWSLVNNRFTGLMAHKKDLGHEVYRDRSPMHNSFVVDVGDRNPMVFHAQGPGARLEAPIPVPSGEPITIFSIGRGPAQSRSTTTQSVYHAENAGDDVQPPRIDLYWINNLTVYNTVPSGEVTFRVKVKDPNNVTVLGAIGQFDLQQVDAGEPQRVIETALANDRPQTILNAFVAGDLSRAEVERIGGQRYEITVDASDLPEGTPLDVRVLAIDESGNVMMTTAKNATVIGDGPLGPGEGPCQSDRVVTVEKQTTPTPSPTPTPTDSPTPTPTDAPTASATATATPTDTSSQPVPGFTAVLAVIALLGVALLAYRRRS